MGEGRSQSSCVGVRRDKNVIDPWPKRIRTKQNASEPLPWKARKESSRVENIQNQSEPTW